MFHLKMFFDWYRSSLVLVKLQRIFFAKEIYHVLSMVVGRIGNSGQSVLLLVVPVELNAVNECVTILNLKILDNSVREKIWK